MDYVKPPGVVAEALEAAGTKAKAPTYHLVLKSALAGAFLGYATSLALVVRAEGLPQIAAAAVFPVGFVLLVLLGLELVTGNFALLPMGLMGGAARVKGLLRNWGWVYLGNLAGSVLYAAMFYAVVTQFGATDGGAVGAEVRGLAAKKTLAYIALGSGGWGTALVSGILCNWMVTLGTVIAFASRSTVGKIAAMWLPIMTFFALGYEHSVVNMYLIPSGMLLGAPISIGDWWLWNQIPVTLGNIVGGGVFTGVALYVAYGRRVAHVGTVTDLPGVDEAEREASVRR